MVSHLYASSFSRRSQFFLYLEGSLQSIEGHVTSTVIDWFLNHDSTVSTLLANAMTEVSVLAFLLTSSTHLY